jgi:hypothetical protein
MKQNKWFNFQCLILYTVHTYLQTTKCKAAMMLPSKLPRPKKDVPWSGRNDDTQEHKLETQLPQKREQWSMVSYDNTSYSKKWMMIIMTVLTRRRKTAWTHNLKLFPSSYQACNGRYSLDTSSAHCPELALVSPTRTPLFVHS